MINFPKKFPSISRTITEKDRFWILTSSVIILVCLILVSISSYKNWKELDSLKAQRSRLLKEESFWKETLHKYPDYRDGYIKLAIVEYELNNKDYSRENIQKALSIDPNYQKAADLEKIVGGN